MPAPYMHSPQPWEANGVLVSTKEGGHTVCRCEGITSSFEEAQANAAYIVQACNSHERMKTALQRIADGTHPVRSTGTPYTDAQAFARTGLGGKS